jgi:hypothetical protein
MNFFFSRNDPLTTSFMRLCRELGVREHYIASSGAYRSLLGKGYSGRAFVVKNLDGTIFVLKVVITDQDSNDSKTEQEFGRLLEAQKIIPLHVVKVIGDSFRSGGFQIDSGMFWSGAKPLVTHKKYYGYLMESVGAPVRCDTVKAADRKKICASLNELHLKGVYHGDARIPNVVNCSETFKWIDFHHMCGASPAIAAVDDVNKLMTSMFPSQNFMKDKSYQALLKLYGEHRRSKDMKSILKFHSTKTNLLLAGSSKLSGLPSRSYSTYTSSCLGRVVKVVRHVL